jgi:cell shape-determining protein MreD
MLGRLFDFIFAHFWFNGVLYFSLKTYFVEKVFLINHLKESCQIGTDMR